MKPKIFITKSKFISKLREESLDNDDDSSADLESLNISRKMNPKFITKNIAELRLKSFNQQDGTTPGNISSSDHISGQQQHTNPIKASIYKTLGKLNVKSALVSENNSQDQQQQEKQAVDEGGQEPIGKLRSHEMETMTSSALHTKPSDPLVKTPQTSSIDKIPQICIHPCDHRDNAKPKTSPKSRPVSPKRHLRLSEQIMLRNLELSTKLQN